MWLVIPYSLLSAAINETGSKPNMNKSKNRIVLSMKQSSLGFVNDLVQKQADTQILR
jgi:hypothetical protein